MYYSVLAKNKRCEFCGTKDVIPGYDEMAGVRWFVCARHNDMQPPVSAEDTAQKERILKELGSKG